MTTQYKLILVACTYAILTGCQPAEVSEQTPNNNPADGEILITYNAALDDTGHCRPEKSTEIGTQQNPDAEMYMLHGKHRYSEAQGGIFTSIPLQDKMDSTSTVIMNKALPCDQISVEIIISHCVYHNQNRKKMQCPDIQVTGENSFAAIKLRRDDKTLAFPKVQ
ncbi:hypothetical protein [Marinicella sp. W31]|uniref:hypothetical protein n=1 Tax=Marinicella sp. W31 TaxID=3023713 RepID=UPI003757082C